MFPTGYVFTLICKTINAFQTISVLSVQYCFHLDLIIIMLVILAALANQTSTKGNILNDASLPERYRQETKCGIRQKM